MAMDSPDRRATRTRAVPEGDTAGNEVLLEEHQDGRPVVPYKALWSLLFLGWVASYADRTLTGPVVAWMIQNKAGFIGDAANPAALGGLVGSMFFLGYMLTQYPGGRLGDRYGHREMIILSLLTAAVMTVISGLTAGVGTLGPARGLPGLGEGGLYPHHPAPHIPPTPA